LTPSVLGVLLEQLPMLELRRNYVTADLMAFVGNALGGKQKPSATGEKIDPFKVTDFLPFFARPEGFLEDATGKAIPPHAARDFLEASRAGRVPEWVLNIAPIAAIRAAEKR
jgi:hypothetical protein